MHDEGNFFPDITIPIDGTNLCYTVNKANFNFIELTTNDGRHHIGIRDIESELALDHVIENIKIAREYILLRYL